MLVIEHIVHVIVCQGMVLAIVDDRAHLSLIWPQ